MLTANKFHTLNICKYRLRVNSPPGKPGGPFLLAGYSGQARV